MHLKSIKARLNTLLQILGYTNSTQTRFRGMASRRRCRCYRAMKKVVVLICACAALLVAAPRAAQAQGLRTDLAALARSGTTFATFSQTYIDSVAWLNAMRTSRRTACSTSRGNLCGSSSEQGALLLATAPQSFDARSMFGDVRVVGPVKDQGECGMW